MLRARHFFAFLSEPACRRFFVARVSRPVMVRTRVGRPVPRPDDRLQACLLQLKPTEASFGASDPTANETPHRRQSLPASPAKHARANAIGNKSAPPLYYWIPPGNLAHCPPTYRQSSSVVEQRTHKPLVAGSIPASGTTLKRVSHQPVLGALAGPVPVCQKSRRLHRSLRMTAALETLSLSPLGAGYC